VVIAGLFVLTIAASARSTVAAAIAGPAIA
jgi:hypothetical protein